MKAKFINEFYYPENNIEELKYKAKLYDEIKDGVEEFYEKNDAGQTILIKGNTKEIGDWVSAKLGLKAGFSYESTTS